MINRKQKSLRAKLDANLSILQLSGRSLAENMHFPEKTLNFSVRVVI
jgi:hypothetical protein